MLRLAPLFVAVAVAAAGAACDSPDPRFADAAVDAIAGDAGPDGPPADATEGAVTITVVGDDGDPAPQTPGMPRAGVDVYFVRPDGATQKVTTGADGVASATIVTGSAAIVARQDDTLDATIYLDLAPGMTITAGARPLLVRPEPIGSVTFTMTPVAGASFYNLNRTCAAGFPSGSNGTMTGPFAPGCAQIANTTVVMTAHGNTGQLLEYAQKTGVDVPTVLGTTVALDANATPVAAPATYSNIPAAVESIRSRTELMEAGTVLAVAEANASTGGASTVTVDRVTAPVGNQTLHQTIYGATDSDVISVRHRVRVASRELTRTFDVGANLLPFSTRPTWDPVAGSITWTLSGGGTGRRADAFYARGNYPLPSKRSVSVTVIGDGARTSVTLPPLPAELADFVPPAGTTGDIYEVYMIDVVGAEYAGVVGAMSAEARELYFDEAAFPAAAEYWFLADLPL